MWNPAPCGSESGWRNTSILCLRHDTQNRSAKIGGSAAASPIARYFHSMPARISMSAVTPNSTSAVPRSGSFTTSSMKTMGIRIAGSSVFFQSRIWSRRVCRNQARNRMSTGLAISEGWNVKNPPKRIQRWVACEFLKKNTITSSRVVTANAG